MSHVWRVVAWTNELTSVHLAVAQVGDSENREQFTGTDDKTATISQGLLGHKTKAVGSKMFPLRTHGEDDSAYGFNLGRNPPGPLLPDLLDIPEEPEAPSDALQGTHAAHAAAAGTLHSEDRVEAAERGAADGSAQRHSHDPFEDLGV